MSLAHSERVATPEPGSDRAVVEAVRAGQIGQYALLYERYRDEALRIARRQVGADEAQDLVQETFARVLRAIQNGGGPTEDVAGYIFRTLRNLRIDRGGQREFATDDVENAGPAGLWVVPDTSEEVLDRGLVADAFAELPPRWRQVLWLTEVEGVGPSELSEKMGMKPTAVSTLSLRARAGFRSAWLQAHVRAGSAPSACKSVVTRLGDYQTGRLSTRRRAQVQEHLDHCDHCPAVVAELATVSDHMGALLLPVVLLAPKALWWLFGGWGVKAGFLLWGTKTTVNRLRDPKVAVSSVGGAATVAVVTAVAMAMTAPTPPPAADPTPSASAPAASTPAPATPGSTPSSSPTTGQTTSAADDADAPTQTDAQAPDSPASVPALPPVPADQPAVPAAPADGPAPQTPDRTPSEPTDPAQTDAGTGDPDPSDPDPSAPPPLALSTDQPMSGPVDGDTLVLSGDGAVPGAAIAAAADDGTVVADDSVADDGTWAVRIPRPGADADTAAGGRSGPAGAGSASMGIAARGLAAVVAERTDDAPADHGDDEGSGEEFYYTLTQSVGAGVSDQFVGESAPLRVGPYTWGDDVPEVPEQPDVDPPQIVCPADGATVELWSDGILVGYQADEYDVQLSLDGSVIEPDAGGWLGTDWLTCDVWPWDSATTFVWLNGVDEGARVLTVQYVDEDGELFGDATSVDFTVICTVWCSDDEEGDDSEDSGDQDGDHDSDEGEDSDHQGGDGDGSDQPGDGSDQPGDGFDQPGDGSDQPGDGDGSDQPGDGDESDQPGDQDGECEHPSDGPECNGNNSGPGNSSGHGEVGDTGNENNDLQPSATDPAIIDD